jgi:hypothetical protein
MAEKGGERKHTGIEKKVRGEESKRRKKILKW